MTAHTVHRTFNTERRREFVRITDDVETAVADSGDFRHHRGNGEDCSRPC
jgi:thiamine phosphate synthase YjbQ (UPF0047 family)